jgi:DMSO/TMAO reductase YedYZ molybdopterin-dependent catalytic subunit
MNRARLEPSGPFHRHPLQPHQLHARITRTADTIVLCHFGVPRIDVDEWSLEISGLIRRPAKLTFDDLLRWPRAEVMSVHQCCGSPFKPEVPTRRVCNVIWGGVRLADLIADCEPDPAARFLWSSGADYGTFDGVDCDAYLKDLPIDRIAEDVLIAYEMNGAPLLPENGYPARLVIPGYYGTNSVKWLKRLVLADIRAAGPFTTRFYNDVFRDEQGRPTGETKPVWAIAPESLIVSPAPDSTLPAGETVEIWGWAWADGGVDGVELSTGNDSHWASVNVEAREGRGWQHFNTTWLPTLRGRYDLRSRAHSAGGASQPSAGARNAIHSVPVEVV